jgi:hypothetical protein
MAPGSHSPILCSRNWVLLRAGEMNDAGEVLLTMYEHIKVATAAAAGAGLAVQDLDAVFGLGVHEYVACSACRLETHSTRYTQYFYNTQVGGEARACVCVWWPRAVMQCSRTSSGWRWPLLLYACIPSSRAVLSMGGLACSSGWAPCMPAPWCPQLAWARMHVIHLARHVSYRNSHFALFRTFRKAQHV